MNTTIENDTVNAAPAAKATTRRPTTVRRAPVAAPVTVDEIDLLVKRPASELTRLVFMALLGCAACIALVGVVGQAGDTGTSPDDPAPAVIVELAD